MPRYLDLPRDQVRAMTKVADASLHLESLSFESSAKTKSTDKTSIRIAVANITHNENVPTNDGHWTVPGCS